MTISEAVNNMTVAQYIALLDIASPLTDEEKEEFKEMSDEDLLAELLS